MSKVIIFPTDTVYGIGTEIFDIEGIDRIYKIKNRSKEKPLACLCASLEQIEEIAYVTPLARKLIDKFMPGPLTVILNSKPEVIKKIGYSTIGVRIPSCEVALNILKEYGPMLTTSVNESGRIPINEYDEICEGYSSVVDKIYPSNKPSSNISSTVVLCTKDKLEILRQGQIELNELMNV